MIKNFIFRNVVPIAAAIGFFMGYQAAINRNVVRLDYSKEAKCENVVEAPAASAGCVWSERLSYSGSAIHSSEKPCDHPEVVAKQEAVRLRESGRTFRSFRDKIGPDACRYGAKLCVGHGCFAGCKDPPNPIDPGVTTLKLSDSASFSPGWPGSKFRCEDAGPNENLGPGCKDATKATE